VPPAKPTVTPANFDRVISTTAYKKQFVDRFTNKLLLYFTMSLYSINLSLQFLHTFARASADTA